MSAVRPWFIVAAVITVIVCAVGWPTPTGWAVGGTVGAVAVIAGVRRFLAEQRERTRP